MLILLGILLIAIIMVGLIWQKVKVSQLAQEIEDHLYDVVDGQKASDSLNGHFCLLAWNDRKKQWHAWTDRFGTFHAYYTQYSDRAAIGTFFPAVSEAASRMKLDWLGLTGFFAFGFFPQDRTHFEDVRMLLAVLDRLVDAGNTVIVIEHNLDVIKTANEIIDLGPEGGDQGGRIVVQGTPEGVSKIKESYTGRELKRVFERERGNTVGVA